MATFTITRDDVELAGDRAIVTAPITYEITTEYGLNADVGGIDGEEAVSCELIALHLDGLELTRSQVVQFLGADLVTRIEAGELDAINDNPSEWMEAA